MRLGVILSPREAEALCRVAAAEDRPPRDQARRILRESLVRAGVLPIDDTRQTTAPASSGEAA